MGKRRRDTHREAACMSKTPGLNDFWYPWNRWPTMKAFTIWRGVVLQQRCRPFSAQSSLQTWSRHQQFQGMHKCSSGVPYHLGGQAKIMELETTAPQIQVNLSLQSVLSLIHGTLIAEWFAFQLLDSSILLHAQFCSIRSLVDSLVSWL